MRYLAGPLIWVGVALVLGAAMSLRSEGTGEAWLALVLAFLVLTPVAWVLTAWFASRPGRGISPDRPEEMSPRLPRPLLPVLVGTFCGFAALGLYVYGAVSLSDWWPQESESWPVERLDMFLFLRDLPLMLTCPAVVAFPALGAFLGARWGRST